MTNGNVLRGVSILAVTPLGRDGRLREDDFRSLLRFVSAPSGGERISSVTVCGEMGEGFCLTREDRVRSVQVAKEVVGRDVAVIAAVFELSLRGALDQVEDYRNSGADALLVAPVAPFVYSTKALSTFFRSVGEASGLPIVAYLNKMFKPAPPSADIVQSVYELSSVVAIKDSTGDMVFIRSLIAAAHQAGKLMIHTVTSSALDGVRAGADCLMLGTSNLVPDAVLEVFGAGRHTDDDSKRRAEAAQARLVEAAALYKIGSAADTASKDWVVVKEALAQMGVIGEDSKYPASPYESLSEDDRRKVGQHLARLRAPSL